MRGNTYTSHDPSPCKRLKDENGADSSKSQSVAELWPRPANLRRESCDWAQPKISASSESSSVEIVKTWLGFPYICDFFQICPRPLLVHTAYSASFSHSEAGCWKVRRKWSLSAENGRSEPQIARRGAVCQSNAAQDAQGDFGRTAAPGPRVGMAYATVVAGHST